MAVDKSITEDSSIQDINFNIEQDASFNFANGNLVARNPITLTDLAAEYIKIYVEKSEGQIAMRLAVVKGGCSGKKYSFDLTDSVDKNTDLIFSKNGAQVVVSQEDFKSFAGLEIDFETEGLNKYVVFRNPNAKHACGCGKSFS